MSRKGDLLSKSYRIAEAQKAMHAELTEYLKDQSIPLDERWALFTEVTENETFVNIHTWVMHLKALEDAGFDSWYDDFYLERYATQDFNILVNDIVADNLEFTEGEELAKWLAVDLNALKEEILASGYTGFVNDW